MTRWFLALCLVVAACSGDDDETRTLDGFFVGISFTPMFSAFGGSHAYSVTPSVPAARNDANDTPKENGDWPLLSTLKWHVDEKLGSIEPFDALPAAIKLTTRGAGGLVVEAQGKMRSGAAFKTSAHLTITKASDEDWDRGDARYHNGPPSSLATVLASLDGLDLDAGSTACVVSDTRPDGACVGCHDETGASDSVMITPAQLAGRSDEDLIEIITEGRKPAGFTYNSPLLRDFPRPDCAFRMFHALSVDEQDRLGLVLKLRSLTPDVQR